MEKDEEEKTVGLPRDLETGLRLNDAAGAFWEILSFSNKKKYVDWITDAKKEETRGERIKKAVSMLENQTKIK